MKFEREVSFNRFPSLYKMRYQKDQAELNEFYWSMRLGLDVVGKLDKEKAKPTVTELLQELQVTSNAGARLDRSPKKLKEQQSTANRWLTLTTLIAALSALERFLVGIARVAIDSDPTRTAGWPKVVDGLVARKHGVEFEKPEISGLTNGEWSSRISTYRQLFKQVPIQLTSNEGELEQMRKKRNAVAHEFADPGSRGFVGATSLLDSLHGTSQIETPERLSHDRLIKWLGILDDAANAIHSHLLVDHIGAYEIAALYLDWKISPRKFEAAMTGNQAWKELKFKHVVGPVFQTVGLEYERTMNEYIDELP